MTPTLVLAAQLAAAATILGGLWVATGMAVIASRTIEYRHRTRRATAGPR